MADPHHVIAALSAEFAEMSQRMARLSGQLTELDRVLWPATSAQYPSAGWSAPPVASATPAPPYAALPQYRPPYVAPAVYAPPPPSAAYPPGPAAHPEAVARPTGPRVEAVARPTARRLEAGFIGKLLAVAGVTVTLIGVVLLVVLAAQAGILRPEIRVGAGAVLAIALVAVAVVVKNRPGGRVGAIALAATGVAAAYIDLIAVTAIYGWVPAPVGLLVGAAVAGGGLTLARLWTSQQLGLLVLIPLILLAPVVTDGISLLLVGFMISLAAVSLPVQVGRDWVWMHGALTAAATLPVMLALITGYFDGDGTSWLLALACGAVAVLALAGAVVLLPTSGHRTAIALLSAIGTLPVLSASLAVPDPIAASMAAVLATVLLAAVLLRGRLPGVGAHVARIWAALSAIAALIAVAVAFQAYVAAPVLLGMAAVVALAGRRAAVARWSAAGFAFVGSALLLAVAPPHNLIAGTTMSAAASVSALAGAVVLAAAAIAIAWSCTGAGADDTGVRTIWALAGLVVLYALTLFTVTAGVSAGGVDGGFFAGHMVATICWIALAAVLFVYAARPQSAQARSAMIAGGLSLTAAATAKLFLFDLGTLDGMFRVAVFIVVGIVLLGIGVAYARMLAGQEPSAAGAVEADLVS